MSKTQADEIATFGRVATRHEDDFSQMHGFMIEQWRTLDESATGFRLSRPLSPGRRAHRRRPDGGGDAGRQPRLSAGRGALVAPDRRRAELQAGIQILPGSPQTVALRGTGLTAVNEKYRPGFTLPAVPALRDPGHGDRAGRLVPRRPGDRALRAILAADPPDAATRPRQRLRALRLRRPVTK
jgi:hypothetical protein